MEASIWWLPLELGLKLTSHTFHLVRLVLYLYIYTLQVLSRLMYISSPLKLSMSSRCISNPIFILVEVYSSAKHCCASIILLFNITALSKVFKCILLVQFLCFVWGIISPGTEHLCYTLMVCDGSLQIVPVYCTLLNKTLWWFFLYLMYFIDR